MTKAKVKFRGDLATITLSKSVLLELGIEDGDGLNVAVVDKTILLQAVRDIERAERVQQATDKVFDKHDHAFAALAEGESKKNHEERIKEIAQDLLERRADVHETLSASKD